MKPRHLQMIRVEVLDVMRTPIETRWTDNSMPVLDLAKYDKPAVFRRLSIYIRRKKLERKPCL